ncbi:cytidine deaminase [Neisseria arctica]|uniref:tRNA-specific adenosine deaminase n=1 Tax=Neisseria arctica TaxID=1470200 RepID=A0A0J1C5X2_9NEIS|nr:tRNA adenosine(34) deaminase TadA [Neisseria arctica]KLT73753.1 cytidine deaminase [Neisseria arctica]UOO85893.1 tRNA adenosine(34) deaminase TadA [Neisseria arctica]
MTTPLSTPPLAPKTVQLLKTFGITTQAELKSCGAVKAFLLLKAGGLSVTRSTLWQLAALIKDTVPQALNEVEKQSLLKALQLHPPVDIFPLQSEMEAFMHEALAQAQLAAAKGEIPVGALVVHQGKIISAAHNNCISHHNISHHAEIQALAEAGKILQNYRLDGCDVYVTLEPCSMCASALIQARVRRVIYGAAEPKTGAAGSIIDLFSDRRLNTHTSVMGGILSEDCTNILQAFFNKKRNYR